MAKVEVTMPKMGESITEGTVLEWHKNPGDSIELDESLLEIGTDKVDTDVPSPAAGVVAKILVQAGEVVDVGTLIALIETDVNASVSEETVIDDKAPATTESEQAIEENPAEATSASASKEPSATTDVIMPKMGESIVEGTVLTWAKQVGDSIELDETLLEIATDKVDTEVPSPAAGIVSEILVPEGDTVEVGTRIAVITTSGSVVPVSSTPAVPAPGATRTTAPVKTTEPAAAPVESPAAAASAPVIALTDEPLSRHLPDGRFLSPLVRSIAEKEGIGTKELSAITGTGTGGRVSKKDILAYLQNRSAAPAASQSISSGPAATPRRILSAEFALPAKQPGERVEVVPMDRMRRIISEHMTRSVATSAHVTSFAEVDVTRLVRVRETNKEAFMAREGVKLTYTPFFVFAAVEALRDHPILNASVVDSDVHYKKDYHIGIAVALGKTGLVVPVIHDAGQKNIVGLAHAAADLATRTRSKKLLPDQLAGGTFTVTNVGSLGSIMGTPIINQPQVGILATGAITKRPVVIEDPILGDSIAIRSMMYVSLSYDHRVVDGAMGSSFLAKFRNVLESLDPNEEL